MAKSNRPVGRPKKIVKRGPARPRRTPQSGEDLRPKAQQRVREAAEKRTGISTLDVDEFCHFVGGITGKHKFTREEMDEIRQRVDLLYQKFVIDKQEAEAEANAPFIDTARKAAQLMKVGPTTKQMSRDEWAKEHSLRPNLKHRKPGPPKKKKKAVWDLEPGERGTASSPDAAPEFDIEAAEAEYIKAKMEEHIAEHAEDAQFLKGKHFRQDAMPIRPAEYRKDFWI